MTHYGEVLIENEYDGDPTIARTRILRADQTVAITNDLLLAARAGNLRGITVDHQRITIADDYGQRFVYELDSRGDSPFFGGHVMTRVQP